MRRRGIGGWIAGVLALVLLLAACAPVLPGRGTAPRVVDGVLDLGDWDFAQEGTLSLDGTWRFAWQEFQPPGAGLEAARLALPVPGGWRPLRQQGVKVADEGWGTYRARIRCQGATSLALALPMQHSALRLYVNGQLAANQGRPGATAAAASPEPRRQIVALGEQACPLDLAVHVSNHEMREGGLVNSIELGTLAQLQLQRDVALARDVLAMGALLVLGLVPLVFSAARGQDSGGLWFGVFCLAAAGGLGLAGGRALEPWALALGWDGYLRALFLCAFIAVASFVRFVGAVDRQRARPWVERAAFLWAGISAGVLLLMPAAIFVQLLVPVVAAGVVLAAAYTVWILSTAWRAGEWTAGLVLVAAVVLGATVVHDALHAAHLQREGLLPYGLLAFAAAPALLMARRFSLAMASEELLALEHRERADLLVRATNAGLMDWDVPHARIEYSDRLREMVGRLHDGSWRVPFYDLAHPQERERVREHFEAQVQDRSVRHGVRPLAPLEFRLQHLDGRDVWVQTEGIAICGHDGRPLRVISSFIDVTERKHQEELLRASRDQVAAQAAQLEKQNETLQENVRLREEVDRIGRHDLKTPLNSILAVPRLLREERRLDAETHELLGIVERAGLRLLAMVNLSLDLYKMEQGRYPFRPQPVDLVELARKVITDLRAQAAERQVRIELEADRPPAAWAEELLGYTMLANLMKNAVEASPAGAVVRVTVAGRDDGVELAIHNRGAVPPAIREHFFRKYATSGKSGGTGLGAYSARLMARVQEGDLTMQSDEASGTRIAVRLKAAPAGLLPAASAAREAAQAGPQPALPALAAAHVLLVDDDEFNLLVLRRMLPAPPLVVATATNGRLALAQAERQWPQVAFLDLEMPVMDGLQAATALRALQAERGWPACRLVALSSHDDARSREQARAAGFDDYLTKPVTRESLLQALGVAPAPDEAGLVTLDADLEHLLPQFLASRRALVDELAAAADRGDRQELRRIAHQLAGSFALYGFHWASERSHWLEERFTEVRPAEAGELAAQLRAHLDQVAARRQAADA